jgi:hypothetical protein
VSYCRFQWDNSDAYIYEHVDGFIECSGCRFDDPWIVRLDSIEDALAHIAKHRDAGHHIPDYVDASIQAENPWSMA